MSMSHLWALAPLWIPMQEDPVSDLREKVARKLHHLSYGEEDDAPSWSLMSETARSDLLNDADRILALVAADRAELVKALEVARTSLVAWNAMGLCEADNIGRVTKLYEQSPEIRAIDAALGKEVGR